MAALSTEARGQLVIVGKVKARTGRSAAPAPNGGSSWATMVERLGVASGL
jgi:hypothetical protein